MSAPGQSRWNRFKGFFRRGAPVVPAGPNSKAVNAAVRKYIANFRNIQSAARQPNLYGPQFRNLPINRPLIMALRNYINAASNFKRLPEMPGVNVGGMGPARVSKQNVLKAANEAIKAATVANNKLQNVGALRNTWMVAKPLADSTVQLYEQLKKNLPNNQQNMLNQNANLQKALSNSSKKINALKMALNTAEKAAGTGGVPTTSATLPGQAHNAALNAFKMVLAQYNNNKLSINNPANVQMYMNMENLNARSKAINNASTNFNIRGKLNTTSIAKLNKVKAILNKAKNKLAAQKTAAFKAAGANVTAARRAARAGATTNVNLGTGNLFAAANANANKAALRAFAANIWTAAGRGQKALKKSNLIAALANPSLVSRAGTINKAALSRLLNNTTWDPPNANKQGNFRTQHRNRALVLLNALKENRSSGNGSAAP